MEGEQQGTLNDSFGEDAHLLDGQQPVLDIWWNPDLDQPGNQEEVVMAVGQGYVPPLPPGLGLADPQVAEVDDINFWRLHEDGRGDGFIELSFDGLFDNVPNDNGGLHLLQEVYLSPPLAPVVLSPPQEVLVEEPGHANLEIPVSSEEQAPSEESASEGLNLDQFNLNPVVFLERPPPTPMVLEENVVEDSSSSPGSPPPIVESPVKTSPCLAVNPLNTHSIAPPPVIQGPKPGHPLPPPPPLMRRPDLDIVNLPQASSLQSSSVQVSDEGLTISRSRLAKGSTRKNFISHSRPPPTMEEKESSKEKRKINPPKKKVKASKSDGWVKNDVWEYEKIIEARLLKHVSDSPKHGNQMAYYVKWKGWSSAYNTWLREKDFVDPWPLEQFWKKNLEEINKLNRKINEIQTKTASRPRPPKY